MTADDSNRSPPASHRPLDARSETLIGRTIDGRFRIASLIARGPKGRVYKAVKLPEGDACAIRILTPARAEQLSPDFRSRSFAEATLASKLTHPNTMMVLDHGRTEDDICYVVMEYLEGRSLHRMLREEGAMVQERAAQIARQVCRSVREAHSLGLVHQTLKPKNILILQRPTEPDFVKVTDFGLLKSGRGDRWEDRHPPRGNYSLKYAAPEQLNGEDVDGRADVYALGVIMFEMLTGHPPYERRNAMQTMMAHLHEPIPRLSDVAPGLRVSDGFEQLIYRCLAKSPGERLSADAVLSALKGVGGGGSIGAMVPITARALSGSGAIAIAPPPVTEASQSPGTDAMALRSPSIPRPSKVPHISWTPPYPLQSQKRTWVARSVFGVCAALAAATALYVFGRPATPASSGVPGASTSTKPEPAESAPRPAPESQSDAAKADANEVLFRTIPSGAKVRSKDGSTLCVSTPCGIRIISASDATTAVTVSRTGFLDETVVVHPKDHEIDVNLRPANMRVSAPRRTPTMLSRPQGKPSVLEGAHR